ncbi:hypothetical protein [Photobacterium nomapromontoriensis]
MGVVFVMLGGMLAGHEQSGGAAQLKELTKRTTFIRVQEQENNVYGKE